MARRVTDQGNSITIRWIPAHRGVVGNEMADQAARDAASLPPLRGTSDRTSLAFLRRRVTERATRAWRKDIEERNSDRRAFRLPTARLRPGIRPQLRGAPKTVATRFFQLLGGHAMIAPFLKERWGWVNTDECWWCDKGRQSREHLFKECRTWEKEIRELWEAVGRASGARDDTGEPFKSRKGFGYRIRQARARPSNTSVGDLLSDDRFSGAVLDFLRSTRVGEVREGVICK